MLQLDEWDELLTNNFADTSRLAHEISDQPDSSALAVSDDLPLVALAVDSTDQHPLRSLPGSPDSPTTNTVTFRVNLREKAETRPRLTRLIERSAGEEEEEEEEEEGGEEEVTHPDDSDATNDEPINDTIVHTITPTDSFAGLAIRYGVSIAALRRANQLWPSDPIHLRRELIIPRGHVLHAKGKSANRREVHVAPILDDDPPSRSSSSDLVSALVTARSTILSAFPARMSLESLSSRTSVSEDHELDDLGEARSNKLTPKAHHNTPSTGDHHELSVLTSSDGPFNQPTFLTLSQLPCTAIDDQLQPSLRARESYASPAIQRYRTQPSVFVPTRVSQLEPEPAMELPCRRVHR